MGSFELFINTYEHLIPEVGLLTFGNPNDLSRQGSSGVGCPSLHSQLNARTTARGTVRNRAWAMSGVQSGCASMVGWRVERPERA